MASFDILDQLANELIASATEEVFAGKSFSGTGQGILYTGLLGVNNFAWLEAKALSADGSHYYISSTEAGMHLNTVRSEYSAFLSLVNSDQDINPTQKAWLENKVNEAVGVNCRKIDEFVSKNLAQNMSGDIKVIAFNNADPSNILSSIELKEILEGRTGVTSINGQSLDVWVRLIEETGESDPAHALRILIQAQVKEAMQATSLSASALFSDASNEAVLDQAVHAISTEIKGGGYANLFDKFLLDQSGSGHIHEIFGNLDAKAIATLAGISFATVDFVQTIDDLADAAKKGGATAFLAELEKQAIVWGAGLVIAMVGVTFAPAAAAAVAGGLTIVSLGNLIYQIFDDEPGDPISDLPANIATVISMLEDILQEGMNRLLPASIQLAGAIVEDLTARLNEGEVFRGLITDEVIDLGELTEGSFRVVFGDAGDDEITGTSEAESLFGGDGDDIINGGGGNDLIVGGSLAVLNGGGADVLNGGAGDDLIVHTGVGEANGGDGNDIILAYSQKPTPSSPGLTITGGAGNDFIVAFNHEEAEDGDDYAQERAEMTIDAGDGDDTVISIGPAEINLGDGNDLVLVATTGSVITTGDGEDTVLFSPGTLVTDANGYDRINFAGFELELATTWGDSESDYAYAFGGLVKVGFNTAGEMVIGWSWDNDVEDFMYLANANRNPLAAGADLTAGIRVAVLHIEAHPLIWFIRNNVSPDQSSWLDFWELALKDFLSTARVSGADPLVLDLDGDGLELTQMGSQFRFDTDGDQFAEYTGWVKGDDGLLALDANANGKIDSGAELFGGPTQSGFAELATHDLNADGVINAADDVFDDLRVWRDLDQDGQTDAGELQSLAELNIVSINLANSASGSAINGNTVARTGSFTRGDATTGTVGDVDFKINNIDTVYTGDRSVDTAVAASMPNIKGKGTLTDLHVAITLQGAGGALATTIASVLPTLDVPDLDILRDRAGAILDAWIAAPPATGLPENSDIAILTRTVNGSHEIADFAIEVTEGGQTFWRLASGAPIKDAAGIIIAHPTLQQVLDQSVTTSGGFTWQVFSGAELDFIERYLGEQLPLDTIEGLEPGANRALATMLDTSVELIEHMAIRLAMQGPLAEYFPGIKYDAATDKFLPLSGAGLIPAFTAIFEDAPADAAGAEAWLDDWMPFVNGLMKDYVRTQSHLSVNNPYLANALIAAWEATDLPLTLDVVTEAFGIAPGTITKVTAGVAQGGLGNDIIYLSATNATLKGGNGADVYIVGESLGTSVLEDQDAGHSYNTLRFSKYNATDLTFARSSKDLIATVTATGEKLTIKNQFYDKITSIFGGELGPAWGVKEIVFADGTVWTSAHISRAAAGGTSGNDNLVGSDHNDVFDGGAGNDTLAGGDGSDFYIFGRGYGQDTISDGGYDPFLPSLDFVQFGAGITRDDLVFSRTANAGDIVIGIEGTTDRLTISGQYTGTYTGVFGTLYGNRIESLIFDDESFITHEELAKLVLQQAKTAGNDTIIGFDLADILDGGAGDDLLKGGNEDDTYVYGVNYGHDTVSDEQGNILSGGYDKLRLDGISINDVTFVRVGGSDTLKLVLNSANSVTLQGEFTATYTGVFGTYWLSRVETFQFADATIGFVEIMQRTIASQSTTGNDQIYGFAWEDTLEGGTGDDFLSGGNEGDTYLFGVGDGHDTIRDGRTNILSGVDDRIIFDEGIGLEDVTFSRAGGSSDLMITLATGETLKVQGQFDVVYGLGQYTFDAIEYFQFTADGVTTVLSWVDVQRLLLETGKTNGNDVIHGFSTEDILDGGAGDDYLSGGNENDTYVFGLGYGHDTIEDLPTTILGGDYDRIVFKGTLTPDDVVFSHIGNTNDLLVTLSDGSTLTVKGMFTQAMLDGNIEEFYFEGSDSWLYADDIAAIALAGSATAGNDTIYGFTNSGDRLDGGAGNDYLAGGGFSDTYWFGRGDGQDVIFDSSGGGDRLAFKAGVNPEDIIVQRGPDYRDIKLIIADTGDSITIQLQNYAYSVGPPDHRIERITFADGTVWNDGTLRTKLFAAEATSGNDTINGFYSGDTLHGGAGNDTLIGHGGGDVYLFNLGDGQDTIRTSPDYLWYPVDYVIFGAGITLADLSFRRNGDALEISVIGTSDKLIAADHFGNGHVDVFRFADGTSITGYDATTLAFTGGPGADTLNGTYYQDVINGGEGADNLYGGAEGDIYVYDLGDGNDRIFESDYWDNRDTLRLGAGITPANVTVSVSATDSNDLVITFSDGGTITLEQQRQVHGRGIELIEFADGTVWRHNDLLAAAGLALHTLTGTSASETLGGNDYSQVIDGGAGNDTINGGGGSDIYVFNASSGNDTIAENGGTHGFDVADLSTFQRSEVAITRSGTDLLLTVTATAQVLRVANHFGGAGAAVEFVRFADVELDAFDIRYAAATTGTSGNDTIGGTTGSDTLIGGLGNDNLNAGDADDVYIYHVGDGNDWIGEGATSGGNDQLYLLGINPDDVTVTTNSEGEAVLNIAYDAGGVPQTATIRLWFGFGDYYQRGVEWINFADGTVWNTSNLRQEYLANAQTSGNDYIRLADTDDRFDGGEGNDTILGLGGDDIYYYSAGDGEDLIYEGTNHGFDQLVFRDIASTDVSLSHNGTELAITINKAGYSGVVRLSNQMMSYYEAGIERIVFSDGVQWSQGTTVALINAQKTTAAGTTITGFDTTNDVLEGGLGNDLLRGGGGDDTYRFAKGDGQDIIEEGQPNGDDWLVFTDLNREDLHVARSGADMILTFNGLSPEEAAETKVTIKNGFNPGIQGGVEAFRFADSEAGYGLHDMWAQWLIDAPTEGNDTITAFDSLNDRIEGGGGNDTLRGLSGQDRLFGEAGDDVLDGGDDDDRLYGGDGDDRLSGGAGFDLLDGGAGSDTADYTYSAADFDFDLAAGIAASDTGTETLVSIENVLGTSGANSFRGTSSANRFEGRAGSDTYFFAAGSGTDEILDVGNAADTDTVDLTSLSPSQLSFARSGTNQADLVITVVATGETLTIRNQFTAAAKVIEYLKFADGLTWDIYAMSGAAPFIGTVANDTLSGIAGNETFEGKGGDDTLVGSHGSDTYRYAAGDGRDTIVEAGSTEDTDTLHLIDLDGDDVRFTRIGNNLVIDTVDGSGSITVTDHFLGAPTGIERVRFADGSIVALADITLSRIYAGTAGVDVMTGSAFDDEYLASAGNDQYVGLAGSDTYHLASAAGNDLITDTGTSIYDKDVVVFDNYNASDLTFARKVNGDLVITSTLAGWQQTIVGQFLATAAGAEEFRFANGEVWDRAQLLAHTVWHNAILGTNGNDTLTSTAGDDVFVGGAGNDTVAESSGNDTYVWNLGDGHDIILGGNSSDGTNRIEFGPGILASDLRIDPTNDGRGVVLTIAGQPGSVTIELELANASAAIDLVHFTDGTSISRAQLLSGMPSLRGTANGDTLSAGAGVLVYGGGGNDTINGTGNATAYYRGVSAEYHVEQLPNGKWVVVDPTGGRDGTDQLSGVSHVKFADGTFAIGDRLDGWLDSEAVVLENATAGTTVGHVKAAGSPALGSAPVFELADDAGGLFDIDAATGEVTVAAGATFDYNTTELYEVIVRVTFGGFSRTIDLPIEIAPVNVAPTGISLEANHSAITTYRGNATNLGSEIYQLTPAQAGKNGSVWGTVDLAEDVVWTTKMFFGASDGGADGINFALADIGKVTAVAGAPTGVLLPGSLGIRFDTYSNSPEPSSDFSQFVLDGSPSTSFDGYNTHANLENNAWHNVEIRWDASTKSLSYSIDGVLVDTKVYDISANLLGGSTMAAFGFGANTGAAYNDQRVQILSVSSSAERLSVDVGTGAGALVGKIAGIDHNRGDVLSYAIVDSSGNPVADSIFELVGTEIRIKSGVTIAQSMGATHDLSVKVSDAAGAYVITNVGIDLRSTLTGITMHASQGILPTTLLGVAANLGNDVYQLTPNAGNKYGGAWGAVNLAENVTWNTKMYFGANNSGADGIGFALSSTTGSYASSLSIIFDTYVNAGQPSSDFSQFGVNGTSSTAFDPFNSHANLEDNAWHDVEIRWNATTKTLSYWLDGVEVDSKIYDVQANVLGGGSWGTFGFDAWTGGAYNDQRVQIVSISTEVDRFVADVGSSGGKLIGALAGAGSGAVSYQIVDAGGNAVTDTMFEIVNGDEIRVKAGVTLGTSGGDTHDIYVKGTDAKGSSLIVSVGIDIRTVGQTFTATTGTFAGTAGSDTFVFDPGFGATVIDDFVADGVSHDVVRFAHTIFEDFADVLAAASQTGDDVTIVASGTDTVILKDTMLENLHQTDFRFF